MSRGKTDTKNKNDTSHEHNDNTNNTNNDNNDSRSSNNNDDNNNNDSNSNTTRDKVREPHSRGQQIQGREEKSAKTNTPSPPIKSLDFRGFDSSILLILRGGNSHIRRI